MVVKGGSIVDNKSGRKQDNRNLVGQARSGEQELTVYSGALPHPDHIKMWAEHYSEAPRVILEMTKRELEHRQAIECREMALDELGVPLRFKEAKRGQYFAAGLNALGIVCAMVMAISGAEIAASVVGGLCAVLLAGSYIGSSKGR